MSDSQLPKPYSFLPIAEDEDEEHQPPVPGTLFVNRKQYYRRETTSTNATTSSNSSSAATPTPTCSSNCPATTRSAVVGNLEWCKCGNCTQMPTLIQLKCCCDETVDLTNFQDEKFQQKAACVTESTVLRDHVLHKVTVELGWFSSQQYRGGTGDELLFSNMTNINYRFFAYRSYINFVHGYLGKRQRRVIPACVVNYIRRLWPDPSGEYVGFREVVDGPNEDEAAEQFAFPDELDGLLES